MRHIVFEAILAKEFTFSHCVSLSELVSGTPLPSWAAYRPVICLSRFAGNGSTWQYPWLAGLKTPLSGKLMILSLLFSFRSAAWRIHTCALIHGHDRSEDSIFRDKCQRNRNSALGWGSRPKRFLRLRVNCSLHSYDFTLRVDCFLCLPLTWTYPRPEFLIFRLISLPSTTISLHSITSPPLSFCSTEQTKYFQTLCSSFFVSTLIVHPLVRIIDDNWFREIPICIPPKC